MLSLQFYVFIAILFIIVLGMPFYVAIFHVIRGSYESSVWFLPYKVLYVWKDKRLIQIHISFVMYNFLHFHASGCHLIKPLALDM